MMGRLTVSTVHIPSRLSCGLNEGSVQSYEARSVHPRTTQTPRLPGSLICSIHGGA